MKKETQYYNTMKKNETRKLVYFEILFLWLKNKKKFKIIDGFDKKYDNYCGLHQKAGYVSEMKSEGKRVCKFCMNILNNDDEVRCRECKDKNNYKDTKRRNTIKKEAIEFNELKMPFLYTEGSEKL